jgi:hypothetical protein
LAQACIANAIVQILEIADKDIYVLEALRAGVAVISIEAVDRNPQSGILLAGDGYLILGGAPHPVFRSK